MEVTTDRLAIRDLVPQDLASMIELWGDPDVQRWMPGFGPRSRADVERWLPETIAFNEAEPRESHNCAVVELCSDEVAGWIGFGPASKTPGAVNFGYAIRRDFRARGFGSEALRAVIAFCFRELGVRTFVGETAVGNDISARVMGKAGMRRDGIVDGQIQFRIDAPA